jgi:hypothetical protein
MRWAALCGALFFLWGCNVPVLGGGAHVQAHGKLYMHVTELAVSREGWVRFADGGVPVTCFASGCIIGNHDPYVGQ